ERPRKIYKLTTEGQNILNYTENTLNLICQKISTNAAIKVEAADKATLPFTNKGSFISTLVK
ncbi:MAG: hypothetical protein QW445_09870, partial [Candidatus Bathyarchaeia archaeon]